MKTQAQIQLELDKLTAGLLHAVEKRDAAEYESDVRLFGRIVDSNTEQIKVLKWVLM